jgi:hypothetical protein
MASYQYEFYIPKTEQPSFELKTNLTQLITTQCGNAMQGKQSAENNIHLDYI